MKKIKQLNLPRIYEGENPKFKKHLGKPKVSHSQISSYKDPQYTNQYILGYMFKIPQPGNFWATFGSYCGDTLAFRLDKSKAEGRDKEILDNASKYFNEVDLDTLKKADKLFPKDTVYEREIVLDRGAYVIQGFVDANNMVDCKNVIIDVKTGGKNSPKKGQKYYGSSDYKQVNLYAKAIEEEGEEIGYCGVVLLDRTFENKWSNPETTSTFENPILHLSGEIIEIPNPYNRKEAEELLEYMDSVVEEISSLYETYLKLSTLTIEL